MNTTTDPQAPYEAPAASPAPPLAAASVGGGAAVTLRNWLLYEPNPRKALYGAGPKAPLSVLDYPITGPVYRANIRENLGSVAVMLDQNETSTDFNYSVVVRHLCWDLADALIRAESAEAANRALTARLTTEAAAAGEANEALEAAVRSALLEQSVWLEGTRKLKADLTEARAEAAEAEREKRQLHEELRGLRAGNGELVMQLHDAWTEARDLEYEAAAQRYGSGPRLEKANAEIAEHYRIKRASLAGPLHSEEVGKGGVGNV